MKWLIDKATVIGVGKMHCFGTFQNLVLYCQTAKCDWTELAQDRATVKCVGQMHCFGVVPETVTVLSDGKMGLE